MSDMPDLQNSKSFWDRKEGTTGMIVGFLLMFGVGWGVYKLLPFIISMLANTITAVGLFLVLGALLYVIFDNKVQSLVWFGYKSIMRKITGLFVTIDPIGILENYVEDLKDKREDMRVQISKLKEQMAKLMCTINENEKSKNNALRIMEQARNRDGESSQTVRLKARTAGRLEESNMTLGALYQKMEALYKVMTKMLEVSDITIADLEETVDVKSRERAAILASYSAYKRAASIIRGDRDKKELFDDSLEYLTDDFASKIGEIQCFMEMSQSVIDNIDLQNGIYEEDALKKLDDWQNKNAEKLLSGPKQYTSFTMDGSMKIGAPLNITAVSENTGSSYFDKL